MLNFSDPQIWVAIAFILFFLFCGKYIWAQLSNLLDNKINSIKVEIDEAQKIHDDARSLLSSEMKKFQNLDKTIGIILKDGKNKIQELQIQNKESIDIEIKKIEKASLEKINYLENQLIKAVKTKIANQAVQLTMHFLSKEFNSSSNLEKSIKNKNDFL